MCGNEGPAKNLLLRQRKNAQQDTIVLAGISNSVAKEPNTRLDGFSLPFAKTTDVKSFEFEIRWLRSSNLVYNI